MSSSDSITLEELARRAHVSPRSIRYYLTTGLLERPPKHGRELRFNPDQVARLQAIRELQRQGLSLEAIARQLERMSPGVLQLFTRPSHAPPLKHLLLAETTAGSVEVPRAREPVLYMAAGAEEEEKEVWVRVRVTAQVELQYRAESGSRVQDAVREIAEFARRRLSATPPPRAET